MNTTLANYIVYYLKNLNDKEKRKVIGNLYLGSDTLSFDDMDRLFDSLLCMSSEDLSKTDHYQIVKSVWWEQNRYDVGKLVRSKFQDITDNEITSLVSYVVNNPDKCSDGVVLPEDWLRSTYERYHNDQSHINENEEVIFLAEYFGYFDSLISKE
jgi:hypothetical protein